MNRAFVSFEIKSLDDEQRTIEGWATTPDEDRMGDIVLPKGAKYKLPMPFLLDHDHSQVVGEVDHVDVSDKGIKFRAHIKKITEEGEAKSLCDKAWSYVKNGLRRAVSIGFRPLEMEGLPTGGLKFTSWEWYELSAVGVPAQANAVITGTKSYSLEQQFVADDPEIPAAPEPAATGKSVRVVKLDEPARDRAPFVVREIKRT
jgi:HK97 family phage prohead protease